MYKFHKSKKGFTLVELMVVIAVLGILSAVAIPSFVASSTKSKQNMCTTEKKFIRATVRNWCMSSDHKFNSDFNFAFTAEDGNVTIYNTTGKEFSQDILKDESQIEETDTPNTDTEETLSYSEITDIFKDGFPECPLKGTYNITIKKNDDKKIPDVSVICTCQNN